MPVPRRTQADRKASTIRKLLDAGADALIELGYAGASVQEICARAGVSQGGLFRHFATREALMVAVAEDCGRQILAGYTKKFAQLSKKGDPLIVAMRLLRATCRSRPNVAWYELALAARSNARMRKAIAPLANRYYESIHALGAELLPDLRAQLGERFDALVDLLLAVFDGEQVQGNLTRRHTRDEETLALLVSMVRSA